MSKLFVDSIEPKTTGGNVTIPYNGTALLPDEHFRYGLSTNLPLATATWAIAPFNTALFGLANSNFNTGSSYW